MLEGREFFEQVVKKRLTKCYACGQMQPWEMYGNNLPEEGYDMCLECRKYEKVYKAWRRHGLSRVEGTALRLKQGNVCAICEREDKHWSELVVDHDHACCPGSTGCIVCVRGLLCGTCNSGLGMFKDNLETMGKAIEYLKETSIGEDLV